MIESATGRVAKGINVLGWLRKYRRGRILAQPFPPEWQSILDRNGRFSHTLSDDMQIKLKQAVRIIVAEKHWEGCGGLKIDDEHRVTIAAQIARLTLHFERDYFDEIQSILVYPAAYVAKSEDRLSGGVVIESNSGRLGEAWYRGPVILSWADILESVRSSYTERNVVIHEFAHQLDMRNGGGADGYPVIESPEVAGQWSRLMPQAFDELRRLCQQGIPAVFDCYGATSQAEFFAVVSESYFEQPDAFKEVWPDVFQLFDDFYRQQHQA